MGVHRKYSLFTIQIQFTAQLLEFPTKKPNTHSMFTSNTKYQLLVLDDDLVDCLSGAQTAKLKQDNLGFLCWESSQAAVLNLFP